MMSAMPQPKRRLSRENATRRAAIAEAAASQLGAAAVHEAGAVENQLAAAQRPGAELEAGDRRGFVHRSGHAPSWPATMPAKIAPPTQLLWRKARKHPSRVRSRINRQWCSIIAPATASPA